MGCKQKGEMSSSSFAVFLLSLTQTVSFAEIGSYTQDKSLCTWNTCNTRQVSNTSVLYLTCEQSGFNMEYRCCYRKEGGSIFGIDLSHCLVMNIDDLDLSGKYNATPGYDRNTLEMLLLDDNPIADCDEKSFDGMTSLDYVSLPSECSCPLGDHEWDNVNRTSNETVCAGAMCRHSGVTCPANSHCSVHSDNVFWCVCDEGYYGYKCLSKGTFRAIPFIAGILGVTFFFSCLFWFISRCKARKID